MGRDGCALAWTARRAFASGALDSWRPNTARRWRPAVPTLGGGRGWVNWNGSTHTHTYSQNFSTHGAVLTYFQTGRITGARHTRTGGGSGPVGPRGLLSVRRRRVPRAEARLRAVSAPASWPEPAVVPGAALGAVSREDGRPNELELLLNSRRGGASGGPVALGFSLRAGRPSSRPPYTTPESATGPEAIPAVAPPELLAKQQVEQA